MVLSILGYLTALVSSAPTPQGALAAAIGYVLLGMYVAIWGSARLALAYVPLMALVYAVALSVSGLPKMASAWLVIVAASLGTAVVINSLVRSLRSAATIDQLTGLPNRRALDELISSNKVDRRVRVRCLVVIDLDDFKALNDTKGHLAGDQALRDFGDACRRVLRPGDLALRSGGDEFVLILERLSTEAVGPVIERLHLVSTVAWSYGSADWPPRADFDSAMAVADAALYRSKGTDTSD